MGIEGTGWLVIGAAWMLGTFGCGWILARLYKRLHPQLAFYKLWAFWSAILGGVVVLWHSFRLALAGSVNIRYFFAI